MSAWRVALRVAWREARRAKGRAALVVLMIGLPVLGLAYAAVTYDMQRLTPHEKVSRLMGAAQGVAQWQANGPIDEDTAMAGTDSLMTGPTISHPAADLARLLPAGSHVTPAWTGGASMRTAHGIADIAAYGVDATDPTFAGFTHVFTGRAPGADDEVALSPGALARLGVHLGDVVTTAHGLGRYRVVGTVEVQGSLDDSIVFRPNVYPAEHRLEFTDMWFIEQPATIGTAEIASLNQHGVFVQSRDLVLHPPHASAALADLRKTPNFDLGILVAGLAIIEVVLIAGSAFAVGARRRQRELALVATTGGSPGVLRRIVLADGIVAGCIAALAGLAGGVALAFASRPLVEEHVFHERFGAYRVWPAALVAIAVTAIATGVIAAAVPAFTVARHDIVTALSGRRGTTHSPRRWLVLGGVVTALSAVVAAYGAQRHGANTVLGGLVVGEVGLVLCTPAFVGFIARAGHYLPPAPRMALRAAARQRSAAAPAISAVMAAVAGAVALATYQHAVNSAQTKYVQAVPMGTVVVTANTWQRNAAQPAPANTLMNDIRPLLPGAAMVVYQTYSCTGSCDNRMWPVFAKLPPERQCPYFDDTGPLSVADQHRARADSRCRNNYEYSAGGLTGLTTEDPAVVAAATGLHGDQLANAVAVLRAGGALVSDPRLIENGTVVISDNQPPNAADRPARASGPQAPEPRVPAYLVTGPVYLSNPIVSPQILPAMGLKPVDAGIIATPAGPPRAGLSDGLSAAISAVPSATAYVERGDPRNTSTPLPLLLAIAAAVVALGATAVATGLAAADSRRDLVTLGAVGAAPRVRRVLSLAQSGTISGLGSVLGAVAGFGAAAAILTGLNRVSAGRWPAPPPYPITIPWLNLGVALVAVPAVAMLGAGLLTRSRLPSERRAD